MTQPEILSLNIQYSPNSSESIAISWLTADILKLLNAIHGPHRVKMRTTIIKLVEAHVSNSPQKKVFEQDDTCTEAIWHNKWKHKPEIQAALQACLEAAENHAVMETVRIEEYYRNLRRQSIAKLSASAPNALAIIMSDPEQRGADRVNAANALLSWAEPKIANKPGQATSIEQTQTVNNLDLSKLTDEELQKLVG